LFMAFAWHIPNRLDTACGTFGQVRTQGHHSLWGDNGFKHLHGVSQRPTPHRHG